MTIRDEKLREHFKRTMSCLEKFPSDNRPIWALFDALDVFWLLEGENSPQYIEAIEHLLSEEMRPALRAWYRQCGDNMNPAALAMREKLGRMAGEKFG